MTAAQQPDMLLTVKDVAELLSLSERTVWRWSTTGRLPSPVHLSPLVTRWRASEIQAYLDKLSTS